MTDLIELLKTAEEGSIQLNVAVATACGYYVPDEPMAGWKDPDGNHVGLAPPVTISLDAALALFALMLPGWRWLARSTDDDGAFVNLTRWDFAPLLDKVETTGNRTHVSSSDPTHGGRGAPIFARTAPLALCAAILTAKANNP